VLHSLFAQNALSVVPPTVSTSAMDRALGFGSAAAAITCTRPGAQPPTAAAVAELLA
jgi:sugar/nucleoside kinase (ribokinase family)